MGTFLSTTLPRQIVYFLMAVPIGFGAFFVVDWYWFDDTYYSIMSAGVSNVLSQLW
jgi:hypothetical protein